MPVEQTPKQLVTQRIKDATNILVTVSHNPSVDELSAALAFALILDKLGKTPTAVFSGKIPAAIEFLSPDKTFDSNVDGLRDFIIALDKEKADRLRYKVEDDLVRVFITPYRTTITEKDLSFSQGDFNVDLVVAFGVDKREDLDTAITAHGRILHDATIITINQIAGEGSLGEIDWSDVDASSLCEMLTSLTESLQSGLIDEPIATALLTGLVSSTDRFRNNKTSPKVMTMAAQLMAAGANQQLIADKLEEAETVTTGKLNVSKDVPPAEEPNSVKSADSNDGMIRVDHVDEEPVLSIEKSEPAPQEEASSLRETLEQKARDVDMASQTKPNENEGVAEDQPFSKSRISSWRDTQMPSTGGSLNATAEQAAADKRKAEEEEKNRVILSHDSPEVEQAPVATPPALNATTLPATEPTVQDIFAAPPTSVQVEPPQPQAIAMAQPEPQAPFFPQPEPQQPMFPQTAPETPVFSQQPESPVTGASDGMQFEATPLAQPSQPAQPNQSLADLEAQVHEQQSAGGSIEDARAQLDAIFNNQPNQPLESAGAQQLGQVNHEALPPQQQAQYQQPPQPPQPTFQPQAAAGLPPLPPMPDFSKLPPLPGEVGGDVAQPPFPSASFGLPEQTAPAINPPANPDDPGQFRLPGQ